MISRPADACEKLFLKSNSFVQMVLELEKPSDVPEMIEKIYNRVPGLHIRSDGEQLYMKKAPLEVYKLPNNIVSLNHAAEWMFDNHTPPYNKALASLAASDTKIVLNVNHMCSDGMFIKNLIESLPKKEVSTIDQIPISVFTNFKNQIPPNSDGAYLFDEDPNISRIIPQIATEPKNTRLSSVYDEFELSELACNQNGKIVGLTDMFWVASSLAVMVSNGKLGKCGTATAINMRPFLDQSQKNLSIGNHVASISATAKLDLDDTIKQLAQKLRNSFNENLKNGLHYKHLAATYRAIVLGQVLEHPPGLGFEVSNIGPIRIGKQINDIFITNLMPSCHVDGVCLESYSKLYENNKKAQISNIFFFSDQDMHVKEATLLAESISQILKNVKYEQTVRSAIKSIKNGDLLDPSAM